MPHDVRDQIVDFVRRWSQASEIGAGQFIQWLGVAASKFYSWREIPGLAAYGSRWAGISSRWCSISIGTTANCSTT